MTDVLRQPQDKYVLRMPDGMRDRIKSAAAENNRSMNAEIIERIDRSFAINIPDDMLRGLEDQAKQNGHSLSDQIWIQIILSQKLIRDNDLYLQEILRLKEHVSELRQKQKIDLRAGLKASMNENEASQKLDLLKEVFVQVLQAAQISLTIEDIEKKIDSAVKAELANRGDE